MNPFEAAQRIAEAHKTKILCEASNKITNAGIDNGEFIAALRLIILEGMSWVANELSQSGETNDFNESA